MPAINILSQSNPDKSIEENSAACINMYLQINSNKGKFQVGAYYSPGLTSFTTGLAGAVRAMMTWHGVTYCVAGNTFYSIASNGTATTLGTLTTSSGYVKIVGIHAALVIIDGTHGYAFIPSLNVSTTVTVNASIGAVTLTLASLQGSLLGATIAVTQNDASVHTSTIGVVTSASHQVQMAVGLTVAANAGSAVTISGTNLFGVIQDVNFPQTAIDVVAQDEFVMALLAASQTWVASSISDVTTWPVLSFAQTTGHQDNLVGIASLQRSLWLFCTTTTEIWYNAGNANFTWARNSSVYIEYGCLSTQSICLGDNTLYFLGQDHNGGPVVIKMNGYVPQVISDPIGYAISTYTLTDASGFIYQQEGHEFYVLTFPTDGVTWVYDISTGTWSQRQSLISSVQTRWLPNCYTYCYSKQLVGDSTTGKIYRLDMTNYTENSTAITRTITTPPIFNEGKWVHLDRVELYLDNTPGSSFSGINLYTSKDGGRTYGSAKPAAPVQDSNGMWRVYWNRLGHSKEFILKFTTSMNNKFIILGATANVRMGDV